MDVNRVKELLPIFHAFSEGREIEYKVNNASKWQKATELVCLDTYIYRIKPEPKYRPFRTQEECWEEMHKHPDFGWTLNKKSKIYENITCVKMTIDMYDKMFSDYTFTDGTPFGIKEE